MQLMGCQMDPPSAEGAEEHVRFICAYWLGNRVDLCLSRIKLRTVAGEDFKTFETMTAPNAAQFGLLDRTKHIQLTSAQLQNGSGHIRCSSLCRCCRPVHSCAVAAAPRVTAQTGLIFFMGVLQDLYPTQASTAMIPNFPPVQSITRSSASGT